MAENGNGKTKAGTVVSIVTSILMVVVVSGSLLYNMSGQSNTEYHKEQTVSRLQSKMKVLETKVSACRQKDKALTEQMSDLRSSNSQLQQKLGIITEILNRLDKRTKKLEDYIYSDRDKEKK